MSKLARNFEPFMFVMVMASGISSNLLYSFPFEGHWLRVCSYIMFGVACLIFIVLQVYMFVHAYAVIKASSFGHYFTRYYANAQHGPFWGAYPMGLATIINYLAFLAQDEAKGTGNAKRLIVLAYALWWFDVLLSLLTAWGISFLIWQKYDLANKDLGCYASSGQKFAAESLKSILVLAVVPLVVASATVGKFTMTEIFRTYFHRRIQLMNIVLTVLILFHALVFVFIIITIYFWSLYVNKIPPMTQVFSMFLILGPLGQGSYSGLLIGENIQQYVQLYYPVGQNGNDEMLIKVVPWFFKIFFLLLALTLISVGYFFTIICFTSILSYWKKKEEAGDEIKRIYTFHRGWLAMTFPTGTMALGNREIYDLYNQYVPLAAFHYMGAIYAGICICWTIICLSMIFLQSIITPIYCRCTEKLDVVDMFASSEKYTEDDSNIQESESALDYRRLA